MSGKLPEWEISRRKTSGEKRPDPMQDCKSGRAAVMICDILVNRPYWHTGTHSDRQLLTGYTISSASLANKNSECVVLLT